MSSCRTRLRRWAVSAFEGSSRQSRPALAQVRQDLVSRHREQRADDVSRPRPHAREARRPGAPQEPQQERLRLVVARVGDRDRGRLLLVPHAAQVGVALAARGLLEAAPLARGPGAHVGRCPPGTGRRASRTARRRRPRPPPSPAAGRGRGGRPPRGSPGGGAGEASASVSATESFPPERPTTIVPPRGGTPAARRARSTAATRDGSLKIRASSGEGGVVAVQGLEPRTPRI